MGQKKHSIQNQLEESPFSGWLLFLYKVPSKPVNNRMRIWRKLNKVGAVQFKGTAYLLPLNEDHYEFLNWLVTEVTDLEGDAALIKTDRIENINNAEIVELFNQQREAEYESMEKPLQTLERQVDAIQKGSDLQVIQELSQHLQKTSREFDEIWTKDFFSSHLGRIFEARIETLGKKIERELRNQSTTLYPLLKKINHEEYQGKVWVTRPRPFVDRMASAWLIQRFIDKKAVFKFNEDEEQTSVAPNEISFDMKNAEFTHVGELCTFEVLLLRFNLVDKALNKIGEIVHDLDVKDEKYAPAEAKGLEEILLGIRKANLDDHTTMKKGVEIFEMLYSAFTTNLGDE